MKQRFLILAAALFAALPVRAQELTDEPSTALVFFITGQSNAAGVAAFSPETNERSGMADRHPTIPGSTAVEVGIPVSRASYPRSFIWRPGGAGPFEPLSPGVNLRGGYRDPNRHGIELPVAMLLQRAHPGQDVFFIKHGPPGHNLHTQWAARTGGDYRAFIRDAHAALADINQRYDRVRVIGLYWDQGESDKTHAEAYVDNLRALFQALRTDLDQPELLIFVRKHLFFHGDEGFAPILDAQVSVTRQDPHAELLDLDLGCNEQNFTAWAWTDRNGHLSSKAYLELATRVLASTGDLPAESPDYLAIARAYADYMIEHGRDVYGPTHTPLFVTGIDRATGRLINPPFPHVKRRPFMPGWERDRECRPTDRNNGNADPLDQLTLLELMHRLTEITGEERYADEANAAASWWMANTQSPIGLYPWGTHTHYDVTRDVGGGTFEFNHVWPYWGMNPEALHTYAHALWDHVIADQATGDFNRHANSHRHGPGGGMEFPWPGSAMIATWVQAYVDEPDEEYLTAIRTVLARWESLRDENGHLAPCSSYREWAWYRGYMMAANRIDDFAALIEADQPELAQKMRDYGRRNDAAYLSLTEDPLDILRVGPVTSYLRETGGFNPERLDILGGPWYDRKNYAQTAELLYGRMLRNDDPGLRERYRLAVLDTAELYMSINPEVQWSVWGANMAQVIRLLLIAHELTDNPAYLQRADRFARLAVDLLLDGTSPLPKINSHDDFYEIERVTGDSTDAWVLAILDVRQRLLEAEQSQREPLRVEAGRAEFNAVPAAVVGAQPQVWQDTLTEALDNGLGGVWDVSELDRIAHGVELAYGEQGGHTLFVSRRNGSFTPEMGQSVDRLDLIFSDCITHAPTLEEAMPLNGPYRRRFSGKHREACTAVYGGFKDVLRSAGVVLVNHGDAPARVTVTATCHDTWDDRESIEHTHTLGPGQRVLVVCAAPDQRFIRRLDLASDTPGAVMLAQLAFVMMSRSEIDAP